MFLCISITISLWVKKRGGGRGHYQFLKELQVRHKLMDGDIHSQSFLAVLKLFLRQIFQAPSQTNNLGTFLLLMSLLYCFSCSYFDVFLRMRFQDSRIAGLSR